MLKHSVFDKIPKLIILKILKTEQTTNVEAQSDIGAWYSIDVHMVSQVTYAHMVYHMPAWYNYGTVIRTGITCKKIPCYMFASDLLLKKLKCFEDILNIFEFSRVWENVESWLVYANKLFWIAQPYFSTDIIKRS